MVKLDLSLPVLSATKIMTWKYHVDDSTAVRYDMIIGKDILTKLGIYLKCSTNTIEWIKRTYQGCTTPTVNIDDYDFEPINRNMRTFSEESFLNAYVNNFHELEPVHTATNRVCTIFRTKYKKSDLHKTINVHCQHLTVTEQGKLLIVLKKYEGLFDGSNMGYEPCGLQIERGR